jgi:hypothetical protein
MKIRPANGRGGFVRAGTSPYLHCRHEIGRLNGRGESQTCPAAFLKEPIDSSVSVWRANPFKGSYSGTIS